MNEIEKASWNKATEFYCTTCCTKCDDCGKNECRLHRGYREGYKAAIEDIKNSVQTVIDDKNYAKTIIKDLLDNSDEYARQRAEEFLRGDKDNGYGLYRYRF